MTIKIPLTPVLDTSVYADGDVLFVPTEIPGAVRLAGARALLQSLLVIDESDQGIAFDLLFFNANVTLGTLNAAPSITDAVAKAALEGRVVVASTDFYDLGGCKVAQPAASALGILLQAASGSRSLWVAGISRGAGTYAAAGLDLRFGLVW